LIFVLGHPKEHKPIALCSPRCTVEEPGAIDRNIHIPFIFSEYSGDKKVFFVNLYMQKNRLGSTGFVLAYCMANHLAG
jgi:hypothetical protein